MTNSSGPDRRKVLSSTAKLAAMAALLGTTAGTARADAAPLHQAFLEAYQQGDIKEFQRRAAELGLSKHDQAVVSALNNEDLKYLGSLMDRAGLTKGDLVSIGDKGGIIY